MYMTNIANLNEMNRVLKSKKDKIKQFSMLDNVCYNCLVEMNIVNDIAYCSGCDAERHIPQGPSISNDSTLCVYRRSSVYTKLDNINNIYYIHYNKKLCPVLVNKAMVIYDKIQNAGYIKRGKNQVNILMHIIYCLCIKYDKVCDKSVLKGMTDKEYNPVTANGFLMLMINNKVIEYKDLFTTELRTQQCIDSINLILIRKLIYLHIDELGIHIDELDSIVDEICKLHKKNMYVINFMLKTKLITFLHMVTNIRIDILCKIYSIKKYTINKCKKSIIN